jgi:hypothetical protein
MTALAHRPAAELTDLLSRVRASSRVVTMGGDAFVPILAAGSLAGVDAELLDEGLRNGHTVLREVSEHGDVNRILVTNDGDRLLLLIDGEQIIGAKQNRVFNASFLIAPGARDVEVAVSCVERGRWAYRDRRFTTSDTTLTGVARSRKLSRVTQSVRAGGGYDAQQRAVWDDVDDYLDRSRVVSRTAAFDDAVQSRRDTTQSRVRELAPFGEQLGLALVRGGKLVLMDLFGSPGLYARAYHKVAAGMLADPAPGEAATASAPGVVARALGSIAKLTPTRRSAPSAGETLHGEIHGLSVGAIVHRGRAFHVVVGAA